jgi:hypothetical protein
VAM